MSLATNRNSVMFVPPVLRAARRLIFLAGSDNLVPLHQIAHLEMGQSPKGASCSKQPIGYPLLNGPTEFGDIYPTAVQWTTDPKKLAEKGDLLFCVRGATAGRTNWANQQYAVGRGLGAIRGIHEQGVTSFIYHMLRDRRDELAAQGRGSTFMNLSKKLINSLEVPNYLYETQQLLGRFLNEIEAGNVNYSDWGQQFSESRFQQLVTTMAQIDAVAAKVAAARRLREESSAETQAMIQAARQELIGDLKDDWIPLKKFVQRIENGKSPQCEKRMAEADEWGVLKVGAVSFGIYNPDQNKALPITLDPNPQFEVRQGDFLMNRANTLSLVAACAIVDETPPCRLLSDKIFRFHFIESPVIEKRYLEHVLKSPALRLQIESEASGTSPTMKNISKRKVLNLKIPNAPIEEQRRIVAHLDALQAKLTTIRQHQATTQQELDALLPAILDKAFKGELG